LDTSFIIAFFNAEDDFHDDAKTIIGNTLAKDPLIKFYFTDYIFDEIVTLLKIRKIPKESIEAIGEALLHSNLWKLIKISKLDFQNTWKMAKKYNDKEWSFTDVNSFIIMEAYKILVFLSYDAHFSEYPKIKKWVI